MHFIPLVTVQGWAPGWGLPDQSKWQYSCRGGQRPPSFWTGHSGQRSVHLDCCSPERSQPEDEIEPRKQQRKQHQGSDATTDPWIKLNLKADTFGLLVSMKQQILFIVLAKWTSPLHSELKSFSRWNWIYVHHLVKSCEYLNSEFEHPADGAYIIRILGYISNNLDPLKST